VKTTLSWGDGTHHHLSDATLHTRVASPAPEEQVRGLIAEAEGREMRVEALRIDHDRVDDCRRELGNNEGSVCRSVE
jgi:hypothetical protein